MASLDSLQTRALLARGVSIQQGADTPVAIRMRYVGSGTPTSVTVTTATNIVTVSTEDGATVTKTYAFASLATIGAVVDAINSDGLFEARILDALRSDASASTMVDGAITAVVSSGHSVYDVKADTSALKAVTATLSYDRDFLQSQLSKSHRVHLQEIAYYATLGAAGAGNVVVYSRSGSTETLIFAETSVSATATSVVFADGQGKITSKEGEELVIRLKDGTSVADSALKLRIVGVVE